MVTIDGDKTSVQKFVLLTGQHGEVSGSQAITCVQTWRCGQTEGYTLSYLATFILEVSRTGSDGGMGATTTRLSIITDQLNYAETF